MTDETIRIPSEMPEKQSKKQSFRFSTFVFIAIAVISCVGAGLCYKNSRDLQEEVKQKENAYKALHLQREQTKIECAEKQKELNQLQDRLNAIQAEIERLS